MKRISSRDSPCLETEGRALPWTSIVNEENEEDEKEAREEVYEGVKEQE
jgi:hypothetical protein